MLHHLYLVTKMNAILVLICTSLCIERAFKSTAKLNITSIAG